jgi:hypothetical protein
MLRPCSHMGMCSACGAMQTAGSPICREPIEGRQPAVRPSELKKDDRSRCSAPKSQVAESMSLGRTRGPGLTWLTWPDLLVLVLVGSGLWVHVTGPVSAIRSPDRLIDGLSLLSAPVGGTRCDSPRPGSWVPASATATSAVSISI